MLRTYEEGDIVTDGKGLWLMVKDGNDSLHSVCLKNGLGAHMAHLNGVHPNEGNMLLVHNIKTLVPILMEVANELIKGS